MTRTNVLGPVLGVAFLASLSANATVINTNTCNVITSLPVTISSAGNYCLSQTYVPYTYSPASDYTAAINVNVTGGIVTVDLGGLALSCSGAYCTSHTYGIYSNAARDN
jgi:hypothetical protein